jgi:LuxR family maltose regulon positive regulatory protein
MPSVVFMPPTLPADVVARPSLERHLGPSAASRLSLITGPAGYGKTTLVRQWLAGVEHSWCWITVDQTVAEPDVFWPVLVRAVQRCRPDSALDSVDVIGADRIDPTAVARTLVEDLLTIDNSEGPAIIVIDDAHLLQSPCWQDLEWVISHQPPALHLVVISRSDPPFGTARLRALGWLTEIRQRELSLSRDDTRALAERCAGHAVDDDLADVLFERTEGWAAGVRLSLLALERGAKREDLLSEHAGPGLVSELLIAEALDRQPPEVRSFLQDTSVATVLDSELCAELTGRDDCRAMLRRLAHEHVFVTAVDGEVERYRYHPLFAEALRLELRASNPGAETAQHRRAARWYERRGAFSAAIEHALDAGDYDLALSLIVEHLGELGAAGERQALGRWLLRIPDSFVGTDSDRAVRHCEALLYIVRREWMPALRRADALVGDDRPDLRARIELFRAFQRGGQGYLDRFSQQVAKARALRPPGVVEPFDEVVDAWMARLLLLHGQRDDAVKLAWDVYRRPRTILRDAPAGGLLAAVLTAVGNPTGPELVADVIEQWRAQGEPDLGGMADVLCAGSHLALCRGDLDEAETLAAGAVAVTAERPTHLLGAVAEITLARVEAASGQAQAAQARLHDLHERMTATHAAPALLDLIGAAREPRTQPRAPTAPALVEQLTDRERTILGYLASHLTFPEIGRELYISRHTVKTHVSRIYRKLGVTGRSAAIRAATDLRLL